MGVGRKQVEWSFKNRKMGKLAGISELNYRERKVSEEYFSMREGGKITLN